MACSRHNPIAHSKYMGDRRAQIPLRITPELINASTYCIETIDANSGYQAQAKHQAALKWTESARNGGYTYLGIAGAATPAGLGGLTADMIKRGLIDVIVSTGANVYHDLHFAFGLPVRHGDYRVDDDALREDETTRIYTQFIHNKHTLKAQDMINQDFARRVLPRLNPPFSTATLLNELGKEMLVDDSGIVIDKEGSFVLQAAEHGVPVFLDSGSNHSLGMDLTLLALEGYDVDTSPSKDILEMAALSMYTQPQLNVFLGEGGPRNFIQTTAPTASEIFYIPFEGSDGCIRFTTADARTGGLSGSTGSEAVSWGKYPDTNPGRDIEVWSENTLTAPYVMAYVAGHASRKPRRLMDDLDSIVERFVAEIESYKQDRIDAQNELRKMLPDVIACEKDARIKAGYKFE